MADVQAFGGDECLRPEGFDEVGLVADVAVEYSHAFTDAVRGVSVAAACARETEMSSDIKREAVLLIGVAAVGDLYVVHKIEEWMLGRSY